VEQDIFSGMDNTVLYPVPNAWGKQGWTFVEMARVRKEIFSEALKSTYCHVAPSSLAEKYLK
jgi:hypothetical protein